MALEPNDPGTGSAAGGGRVRASDADRERVIDALTAAFAQGWLSKGELARRAGQALESRTYAELAVAIGGLTARRPAAAPPRPPVATARARRVSWKVIACVLSVIIVLPGLGVAFAATYYGSLYIILALWGVAAAALGVRWPPGEDHHGRP